MKYLSMLLIAWLLFSWSWPAEAAPQLLISNPKIVLSEPIQAGQEAVGTFELCNQGDSPLEVKNVVPG